MTMCKRCLPARHRMCEDSDVFEQAKRCAEKNLAPFSQRIANGLGVDSVCIVGGAVRDCVLAAITKKDFVVKDWDIICPVKPKFHNNKNILSVNKNSFGGNKIFLSGIGIVDVFQFYTNEPQTIIANMFDFNCNSLFFSENKIQESVLFLHFLETSELLVYNPHKYNPAHFVARALKFQIIFKEQFGIDVKMNYRLLYDLYSLTDIQQQEMQKYISNHIEPYDLQKRVWQKYLDKCAH